MSCAVHSPISEFHHRRNCDVVALHACNAAMTLVSPERNR